MKIYEDLNIGSIGNCLYCSLLDSQYKGGRMLKMSSLCPLLRKFSSLDFMFRYVFSLCMFNAVCVFSVLF